MRSLKLLKLLNFLETQIKIRKRQSRLLYQTIIKIARSYLLTQLPFLRSGTLPKNKVIKVSHLSKSLREAVIKETKMVRAPRKIQVAKETQNLGLVKMKNQTLPSQTMIVPPNRKIPKTQNLKMLLLLLSSQLWIQLHPPLCPRTHLLHKRSRI
jgi:hypothetical protein